MKEVAIKFEHTEEMQKCQTNKEEKGQVKAHYRKIQCKKLTPSCAVKILASEAAASLSPALLQR